MLVLTRKPGEQIIVANDIRITVVSIGPGRVKIGIEAPDDVKIDRQEVREKKDQLPQAAEAPLEVGPPSQEENSTSPNPALHNRIVGKLPPAEQPGEGRLRSIGRRFPPNKPR